MRKRKLTPDTIKAISEAIESGLTNKDAMFINDVGESAFYSWLRESDRATQVENTDDLSDHQKLCIKFSQSIKKARIRRKQRRIAKLEETTSPAGPIFLLKNEYPEEFNKQPYLIPNFEKIDQYMASEYTQAEYQAVKDAIMRAEQRREAERQYDEDDAFTEHQPVEIKPVEIAS